MRQYTQAWNYTLTSTSLPYGRNSVGPSFVSGYYRSSMGQFLNRGYNGAAYSFQSDNYSGSYAIQGTLRVNANAGADLMFINLVYGSANFVPAVNRTATGVQIGWSYYGSDFHPWLVSVYGITPEIMGDFDGRSINETGDYVITFLKRRQNLSTSEVAAHITTPSGVHYKSGWYQITDGYNRNQLGSNAYYGSGFWEIGTLTVFDELTDSQADMIRNLGFYDPNPVATISPAPGVKNSSITVTLSAIDTPVPAGWTLRYTTDGNDPTAASTAYTAPFAVGAPFTPGTSVTVKASYFNDDYPTTEPEHGIIASAAYSFELAVPAGTFATLARADLPITFSNPPAGGSGVEFLYTLDGTDPAVSGTRMTWAPGDVLPFSTRPAGAVRARTQSISFRARSRHVASDTYSAEATATVVLELAQAVVSIGSGTYDADVQVAVSSTSPGARIHRVSAAEISLNNYGVSPQTVNVPWASTPQSYEFGVESADGLLVLGLLDAALERTYGATSATYVFQVGVPQLSIYAAVSNSAVSVTATSVTPGSSLFYTLDGSKPTTSSTPIASGASVSVEPAQTLTVIAERGGVYSAIAVAEISPEYEVSVVGTSHLQDTRYHYYQSAQRLELTDMLGRSARQVSTIDVTSPGTVDVANPGGSPIPYSIFETGGSVAANVAPTATFTGIVVRPEGARHWSRFSFDAATMTFNVDCSSLVPVDGDYGPEIAFRVLDDVSETKFVYKFTKDVGAATGGHSVSVYTRALEERTYTLVDTDTAAKLSLTADVRFVLTLSGTNINLEVSESGAAPMLTTTLHTGTGYTVEVVGTDDTTYTLPATVRVQSALGTLLLAPGSISGTPVTANATATTNSVDASRSFTYDTEEATLELEARVQTGSRQDRAQLLFNPERKVAEVAGRRYHVFDERLQFDIGAVFSMRADIDVELLNGLVTQVGDATVAFTIYNKSSSVFSQAGIAAVNVVLTTSLSTAPLMRLEFGASTVSVPWAGTRKLTLWLERSDLTNTVTARASVDGSAPVTIGSESIAGVAASDANRLGMVAVSMFSSNLIMRTSVRQLSGTATFTERSINPVLVGARFVLRGQAYGFGATPLTVPTNSIGTIYFNPTTGIVELGDLGFEPTDGRLLIGVYESDGDGLVRWTNTMLANLIRFRQETELGLGDGSLVAVGSSLHLNNGRVYWSEAGYERSTGIGDSTWHTPISHANVRRRQQRIKVLERQRINVSIVAPAA